MGYVGTAPLNGDYRKLDDISSGFDASETAFTLQVGSVNVTPPKETTLLISIGGIIQEPVTAYAISGSTITFTAAPAAGANFFGIMLGDSVSIGTPADDTVTGAKIADNALDSEHYTDGSIDTAHLAADVITGAKIADNAIGSEHIADDAVVTAAIADDAVVTAAIADNAITNALMADNAIDSAELAAAAVDFAHIQNVAANSILGRNANSSGVLSEVALATTQILIGDGTGFTAAALSGDATMTNAGVITVADDAITLAKMASGTDGNIISFDASGNPVAVATGTDGQVLTSAGAGAPPAFEDAGGGGGTADFVASGTISNGDHVALNANGTISVISAGTRPSVAFESGSGYLNETSAYSGCFDTTSNKVVIAYKDHVNSSYGYAAVGTIASGAITFGTPVVFQSGSLGSYTACTFGRYDPADSATGRVVISYRNNSSDGDGFAVVGTVSGTSISFGTQVKFDDTANPWDFRSCWDSDNDRLVIAWCQNINDSTVANRKGKAIVGTVTSTSISFGTEVVFEDARTYMGGICFDSNSNKVVITYVDAGDSSKGKAIVGTVSDTAISFGTPAIYCANSTGARECAFDSNVNKVAIMYSDSGLHCTSGTVSGTDISFGTPVRLDYSTTSNGSLGIDFDSNSNKMLVTYNSDGDGTFSIGTLSGTTSSWTFPSMYEAGASDGGGSYYNTPVFDSNSNLFANFYLRDDLHYPEARSRVFDSLVGDNYTFWIGVATAAISDGATGTITVQGGVNESQSGLITGYKYYVADTAVVSTTYKANREVGLALSATKLMVTQGGVS
tara:strand:- start:619 stop:3006 length:2388 start_codon:yes stop_codon:yes gene_type:complete